VSPPGPVGDAEMLTVVAVAVVFFVLLGLALAGVRL